MEFSLLIIVFFSFVFKISDFRASIFDLKKIIMKNISVIGAGTMGNGIAHVFAQSGFQVTLVDISLTQLDKAIQNIAKNFDRQVAKGTVTEEQKKNALANIRVESDMARGVHEAELVVEAATENADL